MGKLTGPSTAPREEGIGPHPCPASPVSLNESSYPTNCLEESSATARMGATTLPRSVFDDDDGIHSSNGKNSDDSSSEHGERGRESAVARAALGSPPPAAAFQHLPLHRGWAPGRRRSSSLGGESGDGAAAPSLRRARSRDSLLGAGVLAVPATTTGVEVSTKKMPTPEEARAQMLSNRLSWCSMDDLSIERLTLGKNDRRSQGVSLDSSGHRSDGEMPRNDKRTLSISKLTNSNGKRKGGGLGSPVRRRSTGPLPTKAEEHAKMALRWNSFVSIDGSDKEQMLAELCNLVGNENQHNIKSLERTAKGAESDASGAQELTTTVPAMEEDENRDRTKSEDESVVHSSQGSSSGFENESNTSSVYAADTRSGYSSDVSPISTSARENGAPGPGKGAGGVLGDLAPVRRAARQASAADEESSTGSAATVPGAGAITPPGAVPDEGGPTVAAGGPRGRPPAATVLLPGATAVPASLLGASGAMADGTTPPQRAALFDSFDRHWERAAAGGGQRRARELGRLCLATFAVLFGTCLDADGRPVFSDEGAGGAAGGGHRWWVDDNALTRADGGWDDTPRRDRPGIPVVVVRALWQSCFFAEEESAGCVLDDIQRMLVDECYLTEMDTSSVACLQLSLDVYAEYGWYILRRFGLLDQVKLWHAQFSAVLRRLVLDGNLTDCDSMIKRRYAAQSLPRHVAISLLDVDPKGHFEMNDKEETHGKLRTHLFKNLLWDRSFIKARIELLGRGNTRPDNIDETLIADAANLQATTLIKETQDSDSNVLYPTITHMRDIKWCALFCGVGSDVANQDHEGSGSGASTLADCLNAIFQYKHELVQIWQMLHQSGKVTICDVTSKEQKVKSLSQLEKELTDTQLAELMLRCTSNESPKVKDICIDTTKALLSAEDAWTMKDNSKHIFCQESSFLSPRPPRKGRRKRTEPLAATSLARVLNIGINDLRTAVSIGRSLVELATGSIQILEIDLFQKAPKNTFTVSFHRFQSSCLENAIEILSCSATTLVYTLCSYLDKKLDEDDLDESCATYRNNSIGPAALLQQFEFKREASKPLLYVAGILSAEAWFLLGNSISKERKSDVESIRLSSFQRALLILNSPRSTLNKLALCGNMSSPLTQYKLHLQSNVNHAIGVCLYERGEYKGAADYLNKSSQFRRQMFDRRHDQDNEPSNFYDAVVGRKESSYLGSTVPMPEEVFIDVFKHSIRHGCTLLPKELLSADLSALELNLSLTLEYSALTQHASQQYQMALSMFQESLILRTMHVGKHSLDVASLHFNMGVVYDDLEQYDQAISRYHESLRIRLDQLSKLSSPATVSELGDSVLLTLKCLGHVYKLINDLDNSICCYVKAINMVNKKISAYRGHADEWSTMGLRLGLGVPVPSIAFDETKRSTDIASGRLHFQMMNKKELCLTTLEPGRTKPRSRSTESKLKRELARFHSTVIDLVNKRKQIAREKKSDPLKPNKLPGASSLLLASLSSTFTGGDAFEAALMRSAFCLGRLQLEQLKYEASADYFETALRSKWVLDPASSSDSDSDFSFKSFSTLKMRAKAIRDEDDPEEGQIYYSLGICNAQMDDHERAVRCFLTAMRYLRRSLKRVDSLEVARVIFDCATSHYYLCNFEQSQILYQECLRILKNHEIPLKEQNNEGNPGVTVDAAKIHSYRCGTVLYCLVMAKASVKYDAEASTLLHEAQMLLSSTGNKTMLAYIDFLTASFLLHVASEVPVRLRSMTRISTSGLGSSDGMSWKEVCKTSLALLEQVKNECWFDPKVELEDSDEIRHLPLSGHICFTKGRCYELVDATDQALSSYVDAANFYRIACGDTNMYVANVLHRMGMLCSLRTEIHALGYFNEALSIRKSIGNDHMVAETLYCSAIVLTKLGKYNAAMERYHEALRIQMANSQDSNEVARTLAAMGVCHYSQKSYNIASSCLEGAVKIRKYQISRLKSSAENELASIYREECALGTDFYNLGNLHMHMGDYGQAMQCFVQSRDLRWYHVGSGTVDKILDKYFSSSLMDEDELLGLAHCLHNIGVVFDIKKEYARSLPHYEEALTIKNAIAGLSSTDSTSVFDQVNLDENESLVRKSLEKNHELPLINKATLSASVTRQKIAAIYVKEQKYDYALFHFSHALRIQRQVLGKDHFRIGSILQSMGKTLVHTSTPPEMAIMCYNESLRISRLSFGHNHVTVASTLFDIGGLHESNKKYNKAMHYYHRALSVYRQRYSQELRQSLCSCLNRPRASVSSGEGPSFLLSTGDEISVASGASVPGQQIRHQYALVTNALRSAKRQDILNQGKRPSCMADSNDAWLTFESFLFRLMELLSKYVVFPAQKALQDTDDTSQGTIDAAASQAIVDSLDSRDHQVQLHVQE